MRVSWRDRGVPSSPAASPRQPLGSPTASDSDAPPAAAAGGGDPRWGLNGTDAAAAAAVAAASAAAKHDHLSQPIVTATQPPTAEVAYWRPAASIAMPDGTERYVCNSACIMP